MSYKASIMVFFIKFWKIWCLKTKSCIQTVNAHLDDVKGIQVISNEKVATCVTLKQLRFGIWLLLVLNYSKWILSYSCVLEFIYFSTSFKIKELQCINIIE